MQVCVLNPCVPKSNNQSVYQLIYSYHYLKNIFLSAPSMPGTLLGTRDVSVSKAKPNQANIPVYTRDWRYQTEQSSQTSRVIRHV